MEDTLEEIKGRPIPTSDAEFKPGLDKHYLKDTFIKYYKMFGGNTDKAAKSSKVSRRTINDWKNKDPEFKTAVEDIDETFVDLAQEQLIQYIKNRDPKKLSKLKLEAIIYLLNKKGKSRGYGKDDGEGDSKININIVGLNDDEPTKEKGDEDAIPSKE